MADRASTYDGFEVLARLKTPQTQWQIVFAPEGGGVRYKTSNFREVRLIDLSTVDFSCRVSPLAFTIMHDPGRPFSPLSLADHNTFLANILPDLAANGA